MNIESIKKKARDVDGYSDVVLLADLRQAIEQASKQEPVIECDCETTISTVGTKTTRCGSDQMRRACEDGHAFSGKAQKQEPVAWPYPAAKVVDCDIIGTPIIRAFWPLDIGTELYVSLPKCQQKPDAVVATTNEHQAIVSWRGKPLPHGTHLYTSPPQRQWVGLTDEDRKTISEANNMLVDEDLFDEIEAKLKEKNT
jgi:hypothetical protein